MHLKVLQCLIIRAMLCRVQYRVLMLIILDGGSRWHRRSCRDRAALILMLLQVALVYISIAKGLLKNATDLVKTQGLQDEFPSIAAGGVTALRATDWASISGHVAEGRIEHFVQEAAQHLRQHNGAPGQLRKLLEHCTRQVCCFPTNLEGYASFQDRASDDCQGRICHTFSSMCTTSLASDQKCQR